MNCESCKKPAKRDALLLCTNCRGAFHYTCVNIPQDYHRPKLHGGNSNWLCPSCTNLTRRRKGEVTAVCKHYEQSPPKSGIAEMSICKDSSLEGSCKIDDLMLHTTNLGRPAEESQIVNMETLSQMLDSKLATVRQDIVQLDSKLCTTKQEIFKEIKNEFVRVIDQLKQEFSDTIDFLSDQIKGFKGDLSTMDKKVNVLETENSRLNAELIKLKSDKFCQPNGPELQDVIDQMHLELNERDQVLLLNEVEITGLPEYPNESAMHLVQSIANKLGMTIMEQDVVSVERVGPKHLTSTAGDAKQRPRPLVARFSRRSIRDDVLRNARVRRGLDTSGIGLPDGKPLQVHINERLTKINRRIFYLARQSGSAANWKFVWTKEGRIFAKKIDCGESRAVQLKSEKDVKRVFGVEVTLPDRK